MLRSHKQIATNKRLFLPACILVLSSFVTPTTLIAQEKGVETTLDQKSLVQALQKGGYVIYLRHAATDHSQIDSDRVNLQNCKTQRNLSQEGKEQSRAIGKAFAALGIKVAKVTTSPYCRCVDTGRLAFGKVTIIDELGFAISQTEAETKRLADALRKLLGMKPPMGANTVLVSHTANLKEAARVWPKPEGVAHIFEPQEDGGFLHVAKVLPEEWAELARLK